MLGLNAARNINMAQPKHTWLASMFLQACRSTLLLYLDIGQLFPYSLTSAVFYLITKLYIGTRIIYDRKFLLDCRSSPLARTPPRCLPDIPGVTSPPSVTIKNDKAHPKQMVNNNSISPLADKSAGKSNFQTCIEAKSY